MNVSLTPELEKYVNQQVKSGLYQTASEVIRAGLRSLKGHPKLTQPQLPGTLEELEDLLDERIAALDRGEGVDGEVMFRQLRKKIAQATKAQRRG